MEKSPVIYWYRDDLRLHDLPGLQAAVATGRPVLACYILDDESPENWRMGGASRWWLHHSLVKLSRTIEALGGTLSLARGRSEEILERLARNVGASNIFCSRSYEPWSRELEERVQSSLGNHGVQLACTEGTLLWEPEQVKTLAGTPYKVYTPFWRACMSLPEPRQPGGIPTVTFLKYEDQLDVSLADLDLLSDENIVDSSWQTYWQPGESGAESRLNEFVDDRLALYTQGRDFPGSNTTSLLSPHLRFGEVSPNRVLHFVKQAVLQDPQLELAAEKFLKEIGWREFSHHLLFHFPHIPESAFRAAFDRFPWAGSTQALTAWKEGKTGYPLVDAGMRELRQTGFMQGRVRMVVASFLCKHLLIDWRVGERWFWETLVDADLANNAAGWQWVAGSGADASPYFRIFNPITQGEKFDRSGAYVRRWVPELAALPDRYLFQPWAAPEWLLEDIGFTHGSDYPLPIVEHKYARESALAAYAELKAG